MERELVDGTMRPTAVVLGGENEADFHERIGTRPADFQARRKATLCGEPELSFDDDADWGTIGHMSLQGHAKVALALERAVAEALGHASI